MLSSMATWLTALGWALLNAYWHFALLCVGYMLLRKTMLLTPATRFRLAFLLSMTGTAWFFYDLVNPPANHLSGSFEIAAFVRLPLAINQLYAAIAMTYLLILAFLCIRRLNDYGRLQQRSLAGRQPMLWMEPFVQKMASCWSLSRQIRVFSSSVIQVPQTIGFLKPVIFFPLALLAHFTPDQVEAILLHELAHIRRNDYLTNLVMVLLQTIFFFNPFVMRLIRAMQEEREHACDDLVLAAHYPASSYAAALLQLERSRQSPPSLSLAASGSGHPLLLSRIRKIHGLPGNGKPANRDHSIVLPILLSLGVAYLLASPAKVRPSLQQKTVAFQVRITPAAFHPASRSVAAIRLKKPVSVRRKMPVPPEYVPVPPTPVAMLGSGDVSGVSVDWTDQREMRDFAQEDAEKPLLPDAGVRSQMPYIPSASFEYQHAGDSISTEHYQPWIPEEKIDHLVSAVHAAKADQAALQQFRRQLGSLQKQAAEKRAAMAKSSDQQKKLLMESLKQIQQQQETIRRIILSVKKPASDRLIYI